LHSRHAEDLPDQTRHESESRRLSFFELATDRVTGREAQRARPPGCWSRCLTSRSRCSGASLVIHPAALDLPHALVEW